MTLIDRATEHHSLCAFIHSIVFGMSHRKFHWKHKNAWDDTWCLLANKLPFKLNSAKHAHDTDSFLPNFVLISLSFHVKQNVNDWLVSIKFKWNWSKWFVLCVTMRISHYFSDDVRAICYTSIRRYYLFEFCLMKTVHLPTVDAFVVYSEKSDRWLPRSLKISNISKSMVRCVRDCSFCNAQGNFQM